MLFNLIMLAVPVICNSLKAFDSGKNRKKTVRSDLLIRCCILDSPWYALSVAVCRTGDRTATDQGMADGLAVYRGPLLQRSFMYRRWYCRCNAAAAAIGLRWRWPGIR